MAIVENLNAWSAAYRDGWLAHWQASGEVDFSHYQRVVNETCPGTPGIDLSQSRLLFISTAGGYLPGSQRPFDASNPLGDYTLRTIPSDTPLEQIAFSHEHYDQTAVTDDPQVLLPFNHLRELVAEGLVGSLAPQTISYMGYQPDVARIVTELVPAVVGLARDQQADAALLVPA